MSNERRNLYENSHEPWEKNVPTDLIPAIKHLRKSFDRLHWGCGQSTQKYCYSLLHDETADDPDKEYLNYLLGVKARIGAAAAERFNHLLEQKTLPASFKAFFDLYLDGMTVQALKIFKDLTEIGRANETRLGMPHLEWAEAQTKHLIRSGTHNIRIWVKDACDKQIYDPNDDSEERIFWRKWQAPMFLVMRPSKHKPYDEVTVWERNECETSSHLLESFAEHYVLHLETKLRRVAGEAALALAKRPPAMQTNVSTDDSRVRDIPSLQPTMPRRSPSVRQEARKLDTQSMQEKWQKEYRRLKKSRPGHSDVWYSQRIAGMDIAEGRSAETIRKHMTK
ncbi:MAG: hypothetical protein ABI177_03135 [Edaphobacter sp.]